jgi:hypothetical protein
LSERDKSGQRPHLDESGRLAIDLITRDENFWRLFIGFPDGAEIVNLGAVGRATGTLVPLPVAGPETM